MLKFVFAVLAIQVGLVLSQQQYSNRYDSVNVDTILSNKRVLNNYIKCVLDAGPCTPEGRDLRRSIPDALKTNCAKCTESQRTFVRKGANFVMKHHPDEWNKILDKYDPQRMYAGEFFKSL